MAEQVYVLDNNETVRAVLSNTHSDMCPFFDDTYREQLDGLMVFNLSVPMDHEDAAYLVEENYVAIVDMDGHFLLFRIKTVDEVSDSSGVRVKKIHAENAGQELYGHVVRQKTYTGQTIKTMADDVLTGTRWKTGVVEDTLTNSGTFNDYPTVLGALRMMANWYNVELVFRVNIKNGKVTERLVDLVKSRGSHTGKVFEYSKDLKGVRRVKDSIPLYTALVGLGKKLDNGKYTDFALISASDKPLYEDFVGDKASMEKYGTPTGTGNKLHIMGVYQDPDETSPANLLVKTRNALQGCKQPAYTYEIDAVLLEELPDQGDGVTEPYAHEAVRLGDTILVKDFTFNPPLAVEARIIEMSRCLSDLSKSKVKLGNFRPLIVDSVDPRKIEKRMYAGEPTWELLLSTATVIVAAVDSLNPGRADYRCDGVNDNVEIQAAIQAAFAQSGGMVVLLDGNYQLGADVAFRDGVALRGQSEATVIHTNGHSISSAWFSPVSVNWAEMTIVGDPDYFASYMSQIARGDLQNINFVDCHVILAYNQAPFNLVGCRFEDSQFMVDYSNPTDWGNIIVNGCSFYGGRYNHSIRAESGREIQIMNSHFRDGASIAGVYLNGCHDVLVTGNLFRTEYYTVWGSGTNITVTGNDFGDSPLPDILAV